MGKIPVTVKAMEARSVDGIPDGEQWQYEPKWDGFRCLLSRDGRRGGHVFKIRSGPKSLFSRSGRRRAALREKSFVLDGEIVVPVSGQFSFDDLLQRIHPAASRVRKLAEQTPVLFLAFDLLKKGKRDLAASSLGTRRPQLEDFAARFFPGASLFRLSPSSLKLKDAKRWLASAGGGSEGVIAN